MYSFSRPGVREARLEFARRAFVTNYSIWKRGLTILDTRFQADRFTWDKLQLTKKFKAFTTEEVRQRSELWAVPSIPNDDGQGVTSVCSVDGKRLFGVSGPANRRYHIQVLSGMTGDIQVKERLSPMVHYTRGQGSWYLLCSGISFRKPYSRQVYLYRHVMLWSVLSRKICLCMAWYGDVFWIRFESW